MIENIKVIEFVFNTPQAKKRNPKNTAFRKIKTGIYIDDLQALIKEVEIDDDILVQSYNIFFEELKSKLDKCKEDYYYSKINSDVIICMQYEKDWYISIGDFINAVRSYFKEVMVKIQKAGLIDEAALHDSLIACDAFAYSLEGIYDFLKQEKPKNQPGLN